MNYTNNSQINVFSIYKNYPFIVKDEFGILYQLQHFKGERTRSLKKLVVSKGRVRIESKWVKLSTLTYLEIVINSIKTFEPKLTKQDLMKSLDF
jgi:hypothetical protein